MDTEETSVKTLLTQRRSRVNPEEENGNEHRGWDKRTNLKLTGRATRKARHRVENETNKAKIETKKGFGEVMLHSKTHPHEGEAQGQVSTKTSLHVDKSMLKHIVKKCKTVN